MLAVRIFLFWRQLLDTAAFVPCFLYQSLVCSAASLIDKLIVKFDLRERERAREKGDGRPDCTRLCNRISFHLVSDRRQRARGACLVALFCLAFHGRPLVVMMKFPPNCCATANFEAPTAKELCGYHKQILHCF